MESHAASKPASSPSGDSSTMFRPPVNRAMRVLDRSFFKKSVPISAATVLEAKNISHVRKRLSASNDILDLPRYSICRVANPGPLVIGNGQSLDLSSAEQQKKKCLLLRETVKYDDKATWSPTIGELVNEGLVGLGPYTVDLDYNYWLFSDIFSAILPEEEAATGETPDGFTQTGHVLHLNLRERWHPYKHIIAEILKDKNHGVRTVINKTQSVGAESEFRTFPYEVLAGEDDLNVVVHEQGCEFHFDFARVYWNSRLETEHRRLVNKFRPGQLVCDVMAGVGPFAVPAGKKKIFVWANDLNPYGYEVMEDAIMRNHVDPFVKAFNMDGRAFIRKTARLMQGPTYKAVIRPKIQRSMVEKGAPIPSPQVYTQPPTVDHFVMNLPATAIEFLDAFVGLYFGKEHLFRPVTGRKLPMIHVYCFSGHSDDERVDHEDICRRISERIGYTLAPDDMVDASGYSELDFEIHNVRLVSPNKQMFCASFRLPEEVAFRNMDA